MAGWLAGWRGEGIGGRCEGGSRANPGAKWSLNE